MHYIFACAAVVALLSSAACSGGSSGPDSSLVLAVSSSAPTTSMVPGQTVTLTVTATRDGEAVSAVGAAFSSSNANVATVSTGGTLTAVAPGQATVTISLRSGGASGRTTLTTTVRDGGMILPAGNTIRTVNGSLTLIAPEGAVTEPTPVALGATSAPWVDPTLARGAVYTIGTTALTFIKPVTVRATYQPLNVPLGLPQNALGLRRAGSEAWEDLVSTVDSLAGEASAAINQGGIYSVGRLVPTVPCVGAAYRAWDFWIGDWNLTNPGGASGGSNTITGEPGGCAIFEDYVNPVASLTPGRSISFYNPVTDKWYQTYIDNGGNEARLTSTSYAAGRIVTQGIPAAPGAYRRITWTLLGNGTVRQFGEITLNGGATFSSDFDLTYTRK